MTATADATHPDGSTIGHGPTNVDRMVRVLARCLVAGILGYVVLVVPVMPGIRIDGWWPTVAVVTVCAGAVALGAATFARNTRWVGRAAVLSAAIMLAVTLAILPGVSDPDDVSAAAAVMSVPTVFGALALSLVASGRVALSAVVAFVVLVRAIGDGADDRPWQYAAANLVYSATIAVLVVLAAVVGVRTVRTLDRTLEQTHAAAAHYAATRARARERDQFDALIHDEVMSTLLAGARGEERGRLRGLAVRALGRIDALRSSRPVPEDVTPPVAYAELLAAASAVDESVRFTGRLHDLSRDTRFDVGAVRVIAAAVGEAVRNSVRHAGPDARCAVDVEMRDFGIDVLVTDDGVGFDPTAVERGRLGIGMSIGARMRRLAGGSATIDSSPGAGTSVRLRWEAPR